MTLGQPLPPATRDGALLLVRLILGVVLIAHGWQKFNTFTIDGTAANFDAMGVPVPEAAALFAACVELGGGALLIIGLLTPIAGALVVANMAGAYWFAHRENGVFAGEGGWELVAVIAAAAVALIAVGPGRLSVDHALGSRAKS